MTIEEIRSKLQDALAALEVPSPMALRIAERFTDEANEALRELVDPPDPYKDMALRPGLTIGELAAAGMIAKPPPKEASDV